MSYGQPLEYVCQQYGVPAHIGRMVIACGQPGSFLRIAAITSALRWTPTQPRQ